MPQAEQTFAHADDTEAFGDATEDDQEPALRNPRKCNPHVLRASARARVRLRVCASLCVSVCVRVCASACACLCVTLCGCVSVWMCVCAGVYPVRARVRL